MPLLRTNPWFVNPAPAVTFQPGFIVGNNGTVSIAGSSYIEYVAKAQNNNPAPVVDAAIMLKHADNGVVPPVNTLVKQRNASALIVDSGEKNNFASVFPRFNLADTSKLYFLSAVDADGVSSQPDFTVNPTRHYTGQAGYGSIVFDVEGKLEILGNSTGAINILSLKELPVGGSALITGAETNFKLRSFEKQTVDGKAYDKQYGKACALINGRINFVGCVLQHTDAIHKFLKKISLLNQNQPILVVKASTWVV
jgi:hypothetical protein